VKDICDHKVTMTDFVPTLFAELVKSLAGGRIEARTLATLRHILIGGEQIDARAVQEFRRMLPVCDVVNTYGHTEASIGMVFHRVSDADGFDIPLGSPIDNTFIKITNDKLQAVADGEIGEIVVGGVCVGAGYLGRDELTQKAFLPNPFTDIPGDRVYRSGDFGRRRADGLLEYCGRSDDQVKLNGVRIELVEVEEAVKALFPDLCGARALVVDFEQQGKVLALAYGAGEPLDHRVMRNALATHLPSSHVPRLFLHTLSLPVTENGKIDRQALLAEVGRMAKQCAHPTAGLCASILNAFRASLGGLQLTDHDDFFEAGGDSLAAVELAIRLEQLLSRPILSGDVYRHPTASAFARMCEADSGPVSEGGALPIPYIKGVFSSPGAPVRNVLLTGATGFVGVHILGALLARKDLHLHLVVRAPDARVARMRVECAYREAFGVIPDLAKVRAVPGELSRPQFGLDDHAWAELATRVDEVVHCAAEVNFMAPASQLYAPNVLGTAEAIHLCGAGKPKRLHLISSLAAREIDPGAQLRKIPLHSGYAVTKWLAEQAVSRASYKGLHAVVYRVDDVLPSSVTGFGNSRSLAHLLLKRCVDLGVAPRDVGMLGLLPADGLASWLASFIGRPSEIKWSQYEVTGNNYMDFGELVASCTLQTNRTVHLVSGEEFVRVLESSGDRGDLLLAHLLRDRQDSVLFTRAERLISTEHLPMRELLAFESGSASKFIQRSCAGGRRNEWRSS
jgi:thioester reductase-like protein